MQYLDASSCQLCVDYKFLPISSAKRIIGTILPLSIVGTAPYSLGIAPTTKRPAIVAKGIVFMVDVSVTIVRGIGLMGRRMISME